MEIIDYIGSDGFVHHIINNSLGVPFELYILMLFGSLLLIYIILKKIIG